MPDLRDYMEARPDSENSSLRTLLGTSLRQLFHSWMVLQRRMLREEGITFGHLFILRRISTKGSLNLSHMASYIGESKSAITGIIDTLEKKNLVKRVRGDEDRRQIKIVLTEASEALLRRLESKKDLIMEELIAEIPADALKKLNNSLSKVVKKLNTKEAP